MNRFQISGVLWLVAAILGAAISVAYRTEATMDASWFAITLVGSAIAAVLGILLLWRPSSTTVLLSTIGAVAWVLMYGALTLIQAGEVEAWTTDAVIGAIGAVAGVVAYSAGREPAAVAR